MCLYLGIVVCYSICSNYALGRKAMDNTDCYEEDAAGSIMEKFYVDYFLKTVSDKEYAADLINRICAAVR